MDEKTEIITEEKQMAHRQAQGNAGDQQITFTKERDGDRCKLSVDGELKHGEGHVLFDEVTRLFESGIKDVLIDMRKVRYTDTVGLQNLVKIYKYVKDTEGLNFSVLAPEGELWETLISCRFDKFIKILRDDDEALGDWSGS